MGRRHDWVKFEARNANVEASKVQAMSVPSDNVKEVLGGSGISVRPRLTGWKHVYMCGSR